MPPIAVLLAGGLARRMGGGDKALRLLAGRPLLDHAIARIGPQVAALVINANGDPSRFAPWGLDIIADPIPEHPGPLAGILAGLRWAERRGATDIVSIPTDTPFLPTDLVARLQAARESADTPLACAASRGWTHPVIGLWPTALAPSLEAALRAGTRKIDHWTARHGIAHAEFDGDPDPFFNANTPDELAAAEHHLRCRENPAN